MADHPIYGDLNDANNLARYNEDRETLKAGTDAEKAISEISGKGTENFFKAWTSARKNPLMAVFGMFSSVGSELQGIGNSLQSIDAADEVRRRLAQAQQNVPPPP